MMLQRADLIPSYQYFTTRQLATEVPARKASVGNIVNTSGYSITCAPWVARSVTDYHTMVQKEMCSDLFFHYKTDEESFFRQIVTGDET
jgi:hypothetical protein